MNKNNKNKYEYLKCFNEKGVPNGLQFGFDFSSKIKDNQKVELCVLQSYFVHLDAVLYLLNNEFQFVGNYIGCDRCSQVRKQCACRGKMWRNGNINVGACREYGFIYIMIPLN